MKYIFPALLLLAFAKTARAQTLEPLERDSIDPRSTEVYVDVPVVTPGEYTLGAPSDAIELFDGNDLDRWTHEDGGPVTWEVADGIATVALESGSIMTKDSFENFQLHVEFRTPSEVKGDGQGRGNSGIFLQRLYEVQILDNYDNSTYSNGQVGSVYKQHPPLANASRPPGEWQAMDIVYTMPVWSENSDQLLHPAYVTVLQNGVLLQNHVAVQGPTQYKGLGVYEKHGAMPIGLQYHDNPLSFRNVWLRKL